MQCFASLKPRGSFLLAAKSLEIDEKLTSSAAKT